MSHHNNNGSGSHSPMKNSALGKRTNLVRDNDEREVIDVNDSPSQRKWILSYEVYEINSPNFSKEKRPKRLGKRLEQTQ
jgi:hypothetical protein